MRDLTMVPCFVRDILRAYSDNNKHVTQAFILEKLSEAPYHCTIGRQALGRTINTMLCANIRICGSASEGYWFSQW